jgi:serine/threonine protein kinase
MADLTGHQLGNYRLVRHLGRGAFAEVYLGEHLYLKSEAALKVLRTSLKDEEMERFLKEAQTLVGLRHPNIVRVLEFGVEGDIPFLVIDYAPGGTARSRYPTGSRLPLTTTVAYVKQIAAALQYAHNRGIIHRDVKPENILLDFDQHILLSDFGLALFAPSTELLSTQEGAGTAPYMPPEQLQGKPTFASDQYSLGIVTYEWLCGRRPFEGNYWALINQHVHVAPAPLRQIYHELPAAVETVVLRALAKDPQQRFVSVQAYAFALERASRENIVAQDVDSEVTAPLKAISPSSEAMPTARTHSPYGPQAWRRVFLTSAPADGAFSMRLQADLQARGILVSNDHLAYVPDVNRQDTLRQVIRDAHIALVVVSPHTRSSRTLKEQLRIVGMYQRHLVFVWAAGDDVASVLPETWGRTAMIDLVDARETHYRVALDEIIAFLEEETPIGTPEEATLPAPPGDPRNPYKGLRAFTRDDATDFFGRDALIEELAGTIEGFLTAEKPSAPASRLLTVIGPSGSGKSSMVMAGLLPGLQKSALPGSEAWVYLDPIEPGKRPLESLILAFAPRLPERSLQAIRHDLEDDSARGLHLLATQLVKRPGVKVVLMIDQFEELFTQTMSEQERQQFIDLLVAAATEPHGPLIVLLTLRADFYDRPMHYPQLSQLIEAHHTSVLPMNPHELRAVIEQPAVLPDVQLLFEDSLVGDLLFESQGQAGALPLLEFTLDQLYHLRDGHWLTRKAYQQIGGVKGALAKHAESTYASLPSEEHRRLARALFLRLIDPGVTEQDTTRRRVSLAELSLPDSEQTKILSEVADTFIAARLLMTNKIAGTTTFEVSHEALIREWARLAEWLRGAREDIQLQQTISEDVAEWERHSMPRDRLYRGSQLKEARTWAKHNVPSQQEVAFLQASTRRRVQSALGVVIVVLLLLSSTGVAGWKLSHPPVDPTYVNTFNDNGPGSLRYAVDEAPAGSTIKFDPGMQGTIHLKSRNLDISRNLTLRGPGADKLIISSTRSYVIHVIHGVSVSIADLAFENSQIIFEDTGSTYASFIYNEGTLSLRQHHLRQ